MHLAEGTLPLGQALAWCALAAPVVAWSVAGERAARRREPTAGLLSAGATSLLFAVTLLPLPVPVVGATSHICLTPVLTLVLGWRRVVWPTCFVLLLQALFFAHGGITTLGVNTVTLGVFGPLATIALRRLFRPLGIFGIGLACALGGLAVYVADAVALALALHDAVPVATTFASVLLGFAPVQVPLAVLEGVASAGLIRVLLARRPDLLPDALRAATPPAYSAGATALLALLSLQLLTGCDIAGIDGTVFGATAEAAGRPPSDSLLNWSQGEVGLAMTIVVLFSLGFVAGRVWEQMLAGRGRDGPAR
ncbi:MAG: energy-coupling factor ABC transporter permease [Planctomycetes bacterium]|nr:energy-coupling factor ABC transporter permease [Planctomycetota bacterium]